MFGLGREQNGPTESPKKEKTQAKEVTPSLGGLTCSVLILRWINALEGINLASVVLHTLLRGLANHMRAFPHTLK